MSKFLSKQKGFTLIEAVVATAVFAFIITAILGVYIAISQLDTKTRAQRAVAQNARYITEFIAKEVRNGKIDYASYPSQSAHTIESDLYIINQAGEQERFRLNGQNIQLIKAAGTSNLNSSSVKVNKFRVLVAPNTNPFTTTRPPTVNEQPRATIILELEYTYGNRAIDKELINVQSTFVTREYPSRLP